MMVARDLRGRVKISRYWSKGTELQLRKMNEFWRANIQRVDES